MEPAADAPLEPTPVTERDTGEMSFQAEMANGDNVTITISGYTRGDSVIRALAHAGSPEVLMELIEEFTHQGDMSMVALALELGHDVDKAVKKRKKDPYR